MSVVFRPVPELRYLAEPGRTLLIDTRNGRVEHLEYPEAAIWDMVTRGYHHRRIATLLQTIAHVTAAHADQLIADLFDRLARTQMVSKERGR
jgi:hypothetical protein